MSCVRDLLRDSPLPRLEMQMLLQQVLGVSRAWLVAHDTDPLPEDAVANIQALMARRQAGEPMAYILGTREFMGHDFQVTPAVLIPRPDTEVLVETALDILQGKSVAQPRVLDLGTGSGAIAISVALAYPRASVTATDSSPQALQVAHANAKQLGAAVQFFEGDWYQALPAETSPFDLIVSNPPYIRADDTHLAQGDLRFEPRSALTDDANGLQALVRIVEGALAWLAEGGALWLEHGWDQGADVRQLLAQAGFQRVESRRDLAGIERISGGYL
ncbi:peptide chain release factor N(5)-glutamine methyltransferase [Pusillimonas minor]|uniref:Release factor glutamine methyltransferase n=1 Tax=Pusillimonas minor TaxID=2697024 RepID=A0A842HR13_9BURK|nr:peptide chain release factor N(5)-glutamine methyltransferase [Pusillimonas minor]MBC2770058.1 peptide chain release factor N(5)-glutamine methyltransferase [Pusillimonas minor]